MRATDGREEGLKRSTEGMRDMLIDMDLRGKTVLIIGGGRVGERKATKFVAAGANVIVGSKDFTQKLNQMGVGKKLQLVTVDLETAPERIASLAHNADFVVAATDQPGLNRRIAEEAKRKRAYVSVVDDPRFGDFTMPVISRVGEFHIAISTGGKSPAMSGLLRSRIEHMISEEDILMVKLQSYARKLAKAHISNQESRKHFLSRLMKDRKIRHLLKGGDLEEAKVLTGRMIKGC